MQDLIKTIVELEQDAEKKIEEARRTASALLARADAEAAEKIRILRQEEREITARTVEEAEKQAAELLRRTEEEAQERYENEKTESGRNIRKLVDRVVGRITATVFDGRQK